jgi:hypothetical protein
MQRIVMLTAAVLLTGAASGQEEKEKDKSSPQAAVVTQVLEVMDKLSAALATITNEQSAEAAKPELRKLAKQWTALRDKAEKVPPPERAEKDRLEKEFKAKLEGAQRKLFGEVGRVQEIPGGRAALEEIRGVLTRSTK